MKTKEFDFRVLDFKKKENDKGQDISFYSNLETLSAIEEDSITKRYLLDFFDLYYNSPNPIRKILTSCKK